MNYRFPESEASAFKENLTSRDRRRVDFPHGIPPGLGKFSFPHFEQRLEEAS